MDAGGEEGGSSWFSDGGAQVSQLLDGETIED